MVREQAVGQPLGGLCVGTEARWWAAVEDGRDRLLGQAGRPRAGEVCLDLECRAPVRADGEDDGLADLLAEAEGGDLAGPLTIAPAMRGTRSSALNGPMKRSSSVCAR